MVTDQRHSSEVQPGKKFNPRLNFSHKFCFWDCFWQKVVTKKPKWLVQTCISFSTPSSKIQQNHQNHTLRKLTRLGEHSYDHKSAQRYHLWPKSNQEANRNIKKICKPFFTFEHSKSLRNHHRVVTNRLIYQLGTTHKIPSEIKFLIQV